MSIKELPIGTMKHMEYSDIQILGIENRAVNKPSHS